MRKLCLLLVTVITCAACGGDSRGQAADTSASASSSPDTVEAEPTTEATEPETTIAETVPAPEPGSEISRSTALAINDCFDQWASLRRIPESYFFEDLTAAIDSCANATAELDVDLMGVPVGPTPVRQLGVAVAGVNLALSMANLEATLQPCDLCIPSDPEKFLAYTPAPGMLDLDENILAQTPTVDDFGVTIKD